jgi:hypothetical protein
MRFACGSYKAPRFATEQGPTFDNLRKHGIVSMGAIFSRESKQSLLKRFKGHSKAFNVRSLPRHVELVFCNWRKIPNQPLVRLCCLYEGTSVGFAQGAGFAKTRNAGALRNVPGPEALPAARSERQFI